MNQRKNVYSMGIAMLILAILLLVAIQLTKVKQEEQISTLAITHDLSQLWHWSDSLIVGGGNKALWTIRMDVTHLSSSTYDELSEVLFQDSNEEPLERIITNHGATIRSTDSSIELPISLTLQQTEHVDNAISLYILLESHHDKSINEEALQAYISLLTQRMDNLDLSYKTLMKVHGFTEHHNAIRELEKLSLGQRIDQYEDNGTESVTLYSDKLFASQMLKYGRVANLQIAVHDSTENNRTEVTFGIPLITGDFSN